jgi:hypothetical protein
MPTTGSTPAASTLVYADGWSDLTIIANQAKTEVSPGGHFSTSRNACGKEAYGAIDLAEWNAIAQGANAAVAAHPLAEETCFPLPDSVTKMDGTAELTLFQHNGATPAAAPTTGAPNGTAPASVLALSEASSAMPSPTPSATPTKITIFTIRGSDACTTIADPAVARALLSAIDTLVVNADKEGCPNGWGSG